MSRCFPFPPPGYNKKIKIDETDLLTKEKRKEKKLKKDRKEKKEKRDKEKREGEERSKKKSKEKKDRRSKQKDKKDGDRDKEKAVGGVSKAEPQLLNGNGSNYASSNLSNNIDGESKHIEELARRIRDEEKATERRSVQKIKITEQKNGEMPPESVSFRVCHGNENLEQKGITRQINDVQRKLTNSKARNVVARKSFVEKHKILNGFSKTVETKKTPQNWDENFYSKLRDGEQPKERKSHSGEGCFDGKAKEIDKFSQEQFKFNEGEMRPYGRSIESVDTRENRQQDCVMNIDKNPSGNGNLGKRKTHQINGWLHENGRKSTKVERLASQPAVTEHGKEQTPQRIEWASEHTEAASKLTKVEKVRRINGSVKPQLPAIPQSSPAPAITQVNETSLATPKPAHPDMEYLTQILSIPKVEDLPDSDDQEWLLGGNHVRLKTSASEPDGRTEKIWDKAVRIESADITALPFVIPY